VKTPSLFLTLVPKAIIKRLEAILAMAGWFTHLLVALRTLEKLSEDKRKLISDFAHFDDYLFGSVAPDLRYLKNVNRDITHKPFGKKSSFQAFNSATSFVAGYETHLIADDKWESIVNLFEIDINKNEQKFALYFGIDRYFQLKSEWFLPITFSGNIIRAEDVSLLESLEFTFEQISQYKSAVSAYLLLPDVTSFILFLTKLPFLPRLPPRFKEKAIVDIFDSVATQKKEINNFFKESVSPSAKEIEENL